LRGVAGRNIAGAAWDALAAKQASAAQAMQRGEQIRALSVQTGIPEVHLHGSVPLGGGRMPTPAPSNQAQMDAQRARDAAMAQAAQAEQMRRAQEDMARMIRNAHHHGPRQTGGFQPPFHPSLPGSAPGYIPGTHGHVPPPVIGGVASASHDVAADMARFNLQSDLDAFNTETDADLDQYMQQYFPDIMTFGDPTAASSGAPAASSSGAPAVRRLPPARPAHLVPQPPPGINLPPGAPPLPAGAPPPLPAGPPPAHPVGSAQTPIDVVSHVFTDLSGLREDTREQIEHKILRQRMANREAHDPVDILRGLKELDRLKRKKNPALAPQPALAPGSTGTPSVHGDSTPPGSPRPNTRIRKVARAIDKARHTRLA